MDISLDGVWNLYYGPERKGRHEELKNLCLDEFPMIQGTVPGNVETDLVAAGVEGDPFYSDNIHKFRKYEYYQWIYEREFTITEDYDPDYLYAEFSGIDTYADIYINGIFLGSVSNMFIGHEFHIGPLVNPRCNNIITIHIHSAMNYARSKEYTMAMRGTGHRNEICHMRKAPHCFGWDIAPRLVSAGIWRGIRIYERPAIRITEAYYATPKLENGGIWLHYGYRFLTETDTLEGYTLRVRGESGESRFYHQAPAHFISGNHSIFIPEPKLWWPKGYGEQNLYEVVMELLHYGKIVHSRRERIGLRVFRLERDFNPTDQKFKLLVNETPIFAMGTNWVPLDALHHRDPLRLREVHDLCVEAGCNIIRCWGGNVYEDTPFYDLCDERGIMVWQDFAMGNTNYPQTDEFSRVMEGEASQVIKKFRNHPSLVLWAGDNEVDFKNMGYMYPTYDSRHNRVAHETLKKMVQAHDPYRYFIASSPEIPAGFHGENVPEQHTWGQRAWYKDDFYKHSKAKFISEAGYHGCPDPESIKKFIPREYYWPWDNKIWAVHSTEDVFIEPVLNLRNALMANQVEIICGEQPEEIGEFAVISQFSQGEALKFFVERTRALKWDRTGIIWWNMIDCWPQISDAVVDYYFVKKLAFHYLKRVQRPVCMFMSELNDWYHDLIISNDTREEICLIYRVENPLSKEKIAGGTKTVKAGENLVAEKIKVIPGKRELYLIYWEMEGITFGNHYITGFPPYGKETIFKWLEKINQLP